MPRTLRRPRLPFCFLWIYGFSLLFDFQALVLGGEAGFALLSMFLATDFGASGEMAEEDAAGSSVDFLA